MFGAKWKFCKGFPPFGTHQYRLSTSNHSHLSVFCLPQSVRGYPLWCGLGTVTYSSFWVNVWCKLKILQGIPPFSNSPIQIINLQSFPSKCILSSAMSAGLSMVMWTRNCDVFKFLSKCLVQNENFARDSPLFELTKTDYQPPIIPIWVCSVIRDVCGVIHCDVCYEKSGSKSVTAAKLCVKMKQPRMLHPATYVCVDTANFLYSK